MEKIILGLILTMLVLPTLGIAAGPIAPPKDVDIWTVLNTITNYLLGILVVAAAIAILIAGFYFVTAQGDAEKVKTARNFVIWALVGVIVGITAYALVKLAASMAGVTVTL